MFWGFLRISLAENKKEIPSDDDVLKKELELRAAVIEELVDTTVKYLFTTMFWFIEARDSTSSIKPSERLIDEFNAMVLDDIVATYRLVPHDEYIFRARIMSVIRQYTVLTVNESFRGKDNTCFKLQGMVVETKHPVEGAISTTNFSITGGVGDRDWSRFTPVEQQVIRDFAFDMYKGGGDQRIPTSIKLTEKRFTCTFTRNVMGA